MGQFGNRSSYRKQRERLPHVIAVAREMARWERRFLAQDALLPPFISAGAWAGQAIQDVNERRKWLQIMRTAFGVGEDLEMRRVHTLYHFQLA